MSMIDPTRRRLFALAAFSWLGAASALHAQGSAGRNAAASLADEQFRDEALAALIVMRDGQRPLLCLASSLNFSLKRPAGTSRF